MCICINDVHDLCFGGQLKNKRVICVNDFGILSFCIHNRRGGRDTAHR